MLRALIVEDEPLARQTLRDFAGEIDNLAIVGEAADGRTAIDLIDQLRPDLVLLDVEMPELSGLEVINRVAHQPAMIFTTAYDQYAVRAFEVEAADYLLKPFGRERFRAAIERVRRRIGEEPETESEGRSSNEHAPRSVRPPEGLTRLFVRSKQSIVPIKVDDVSHFEADDDYVKVHVGGQTHLISQTLDELGTRLDPSRFCRVHRSIIVNLELVERVETQDRRLLLILQDKTEILASRSGSQTLRKLIF